MSRRTTTVTIQMPFRRHDTLLVDERPMRVLKTSGAGPYTLKVRPANWFDRLVGGLRWRLAAPVRTFRRWAGIPLGRGGAAT